GNSVMASAKCCVRCIPICDLPAPIFQFRSPSFNVPVLPPSWINKTKTLARFTGLQTLVQAVMAVSGFLIVRTLSKSDYAAYTIAASFQTLLNSLTDCGVGTGLNAIGGRVWQDGARLNGLVGAS